MTNFLDKLRRAAKWLRKAYRSGETQTVARVSAVLPDAQISVMPMRCMFWLSRRGLKAGPS